VASRVAADLARAALTEKGATALVSQVDRWVDNADKLRSADWKNMAS